MTLEGRARIDSVRRAAASSAQLSKELAMPEQAVRVLVVDDEPSICKALSIGAVARGL